MRSKAPLADDVDRVLEIFAAALELEGVESLELVICGGVALRALGLVDRTTKDLAVLARVFDGTDVGLEAIARPITRAAERVERQLALAPTWLDLNPLAIQRLGLPEGLLDRATQTRNFGVLTVRFISRYDQIT